jgi:predicted aspartyl protease
MTLPSAYQSEPNRLRALQANGEDVMKSNQGLFRALIRVIVVLALATVPGFAESQATVPTHPYQGSRTVVAVKINGAGPYDFMVDTGATVTVLDPALFDELGLRPVGLSQVASAAGTSRQILAVVREITLDRFLVPNITVVTMRASLFSSGHGAIRGILGENFLRHFDILIDNEHGKMTLDAGDGLADSLTGERLPITFPSLPQDDDNRYRPTIWVTAEAFGHARLLLDSGAPSIMLLQWGGKLNGYGSSMHLETVNGSVACKASADLLHLGKRLVGNLTVLTCHSALVKPQEREGILPTAIFKKIFISHASSYVIIDPTRRPTVP